MKKIFIYLGIIFALIFPKASFSINIGNLNFSGSIEVIWKNIEGKENSFSLEEIETEFEVDLGRNISTSILLRPDTPEEILDEVDIHLNKLPLSIKAGKYVIPFGVFKFFLISDPFIKEYFETNKTGVTFSYLNKGYLCHFSLYDSKSLAFNLTLNPKKDFSLAFSSKKENNNLSFSLHLTSIIKRLTLITEVCRTISKNKEVENPSACFLALGYKLKKAFEFALRYEEYQDKESNKRICLGSNYYLSENTHLTLEYSIAYQRKKEFFLKLGTNF